MLTEAYRIRLIL